MVLMLLKKSRKKSYTELELDMGCSKIRMEHTCC